MVLKKNQFSIFRGTMKYFFRIVTVLLCMAVIFNQIIYAQSAIQERNDYLVAVTEMDDGLYQSAEISLRRFLSRYASSELREEVLFRVGQVEFFLGKYDESRKFFKEFEISFPFSDFKDRAYIIIGHSYYNEQKLRECSAVIFRSYR